MSVRATGFHIFSPQPFRAADCGTILNGQVQINPMPVSKFPLVDGGLMGMLTCSGCIMAQPFQTLQQASTDITVTLLSVTCRDLKPGGSHSCLVCFMYVDV